MVRLVIFMFNNANAQHFPVGHSLLAKNREKAWYQYYVTERKWWTRLVCNVDSTRFGNDGNVPTQYAANTASDQIVKLA